MVLGTNVPLSSIPGLWEPIRLTSTCHFLFLKAQIAFYTRDSQQSKANTQNRPSKQSHGVTAYLLGLEAICTQTPFLHVLEWESRNQVQGNKKENCLYVNAQTLWKHHRKHSYFFVANLIIWGNILKCPFLGANWETQPLFLHTHTPQCIIASSSH